MKASRRTKGKRKKDSLVGFVPIQIVNLSLEEVQLRNQKYVGMAKPTQCYEIDNHDEYDVSVVQRGVNNREASEQKLEEYLCEKWLTLGEKNDKFWNLFC